MFGGNPVSFTPNQWLNKQKTNPTENPKFQGSIPCAYSITHYVQRTGADDIEEILLTCKEDEKDSPKNFRSEERPWTITPNTLKNAKTTLKLKHNKNSLQQPKATPYLTQISIIPSYNYRQHQPSRAEQKQSVNYNYISLQFKVNVVLNLIPPSDSLLKLKLKLEVGLWREARNPLLHDVKSMFICCVSRLRLTLELTEQNVLLLFV